MAKQKEMSEEEPKTPRKRTVRRARDPRQRENQMIALATDAAEKCLRDGTASPAIITHYLKLSTEKYRYENEKLERENKMLEAKTEAIESQKRSEEFYEKVIDSFKSYAGGNFK